MHFQHDNAPPHKAKITQEVLMNSKISVLEWPPFSPDINPIENIWWIFKQKVQQCNSTTLEELQVAIMDIWQNDASLNEACKAVIDSMPRRISRRLHQMLVNSFNFVIRELSLLFMHLFYNTKWIFLILIINFQTMQFLCRTSD